MILILNFLVSLFFLLHIPYSDLCLSTRSMVSILNRIGLSGRFGHQPTPTAPKGRTLLRGQVGPHGHHGPVDPIPPRHHVGLLVQQPVVLDPHVLPIVEAEDGLGLECTGGVRGAVGRVVAHHAHQVLWPGEPVAQAGVGHVAVLRPPVGLLKGTARVVGAEDAQVGGVVFHQPDVAVAEHGHGGL